MEVSETTSEEQHEHNARNVRDRPLNTLRSQITAELRELFRRRRGDGSSE